MIETGKVTKVDGGNITVRFERKTDCEKCKMCSFSENSKYFEIELYNGINADKGDIVAVEMPQKVVLFSSFIVYIIPLLFCAAGLFAGYSLWGETAAIIICGISLILGFVFIMLLDKYLNKKNIVKKPRVTDIIKPNKDI